MMTTDDGASTPSQRRALGVLALVAAAALVWLSLPVASGLFLGALLAFSLLDAYRWLCPRVRSPGLAALLLSLGSGILLVGALAVLFYFVVDRGLTAATALAHGFEPAGPLRKSLLGLEEAARHSPVGPIDVAMRIREAAGTVASRLTGIASALADATFRALLVLFFTVMASFFVLRHWTDIVDRAERLLPLHPRHTRAALACFQSVGKEVFVGTLLTGLAQGLLAWIGYAIAGLPEAALLGALTAIASLIPAVGTLLVWVPGAIVLIVSGHVASGVFLLAWGTLVVGVVSDYVIRPRLLGRNREIPKLVTFISLFGGVAALGLIGLVLGPVIGSVAYALLRTYEREVGETRQRAIDDAPDRAPS